MSFRLLAAAAAALLLPVRGHAQDAALNEADGEPLISSAVRAAHPTSCIGALPADAFRPTMVYLVADHAGAPFPRVPREGLLAVRLATESIAWHARALLGAPEGLLPPPDTLLTWRNVGRHLHLVGHRDGSLTWTYPWDTPGHPPVRDSVGEIALALLGRAVDAALARNERFAWPDGVEGDSIAFLIRFDYPESFEGQKPEPMRGEHAAELMVMRIPVMTPVRPGRMGRIAYPEELRRRGVTGTLQMQFIVDPAGRPLQGSVRDLWPEKRPRLQGNLRHYYEEFLFEVKRALMESTYQPARIGGCAVPQLVQQPFTFDLQR
jgi:hypothetical protein